MNEQNNNGEEVKTFGTLFDNLNYESPEVIDKLIDDMSEKEIKYLTILALKSAFNRNSYSLIESEIVSKIIRNFSKF
jgi:hypothetical protein